MSESEFLSLPYINWQNKNVVIDHFQTLLSSKNVRKYNIMIVMLATFKTFEKWSEIASISEDLSRSLIEFPSKGCWDSLTWHILTPLYKRGFGLFTAGRESQYYYRLFRTASHCIPLLSSILVIAVVTIMIHVERQHMHVQLVSERLERWRHLMWADQWRRSAF